jgi:hypothetical protein
LPVVDLCFLGLFLESIETPRGMILMRFMGIFNNSITQKSEEKNSLENKSIRVDSECSGFWLGLPRWDTKCTGLWPG